MDIKIYKCTKCTVMLHNEQQARAHQIKKGHVVTETNGGELTSVQAYKDKLAE